MVDERHYDAIVIGSGIGGLTTAAILAKLRHQRVLVLERHYVPGGFTHEFKRPDGRKWDVGVHYVGDLGPASPMRAIFDYVSDGDVQWIRMPEPYDRIVDAYDTWMHQVHMGGVIGGV
jgi:phytoene dehydrogenase-like protein